MALSVSLPDTRKLPFLCMCTKIWRETKEILLNRQNFGRHRKSMSLKTTVTTDFRLEIETVPFCSNAKKSEPTRLYTINTEGTSRAQSNWS